MPIIISKNTGVAEEVFRNKKKLSAFLGVSLRNEFFSKENVKEYIMWGSKLFEEFVIILMDYPDRHSIRVFKKVDEKSAFQKAMAISINTKKAYERVIIQTGVKNVKIVRFSDFQTNQKFIHLKCQIDKALIVNKQFKDSLTNTMKEAIGRKMDDFFTEEKNDVDEQNLLQNELFQYVIEEFTAILFFSENGYPIEIDPHIEFPTKKLLYENKLPEVYKALGLTLRGHIFAEIENASYNSSRLKYE